MIFICGEENVIQPKEKPVDERAKRPNDVEERKEENAFSSEAGGGVFCGEEWAVEGAPEKAEVIFHGREWFLAFVFTHKKPVRAFSNILSPINVFTADVLWVFHKGFDAF